MADKMTLQQIRDGLQKLFNAGPNTACAAFPLAQWINGIDAHIAAMGEPVAEVQQREPYLDGSPNPMKQLKWTLSNCEDDLPVGTKLYLAPPASGDWDKVRRVITSIDLRAETRLDLQCKEWFLKLTAALPENAK